MDPYTKYLPELEEEMRWVLTPEIDPAPTDTRESPELLYGMIHYHMGWADANFHPIRVDAGKRLRPIFLLLCCEAQGGQWNQALPAAAAVELLHNFTLIHDDIEDRDEFRRGRATLWTIWGEAQAINAGDALYTLAYRALLSLDAVNLPAERVLQAARCYSHAILKITEGQCWDIGFETISQVSETAYLTMIRGKTATLLGMACELGAIIAGADPDAIQAMRTFGEAVGMAFQMNDDLLGLWGNPQRTGKPVGADLRRRKKTLPILHGMAHSPEFAAMMEGAGLDDAAIVKVLALLEKAGSHAYTLTQAQHFHDQAMTAWKQSHGTGEAQIALLELAEKLMNRDR
ncbi:MAG: polyprenyl synthetase family protein [Anaerolineae bacterium]|nr:polyprenyl synthetase family protein [Anaerolineae bacterium]